MWWKVWKWTKTLVGTVVVVVPVTVTALDVFGHVGRVNGESMQPVLNPNLSDGKRDLVFLNKWGIKSYDFKRGEIVVLTIVFGGPLTSQLSHTAEPQCNIHVDDCRNRAYVICHHPGSSSTGTHRQHTCEHRQHTCEHRQAAIVWVYTSPRDPKKSLVKRIVGLEGDTVRKRCKNCQYDGAIVSTVTIPRGHCWVEGDNTKRSMDSNFYGAVPLALVKGRASHIVWPPSRQQKLEPSVTDPQRIWRGRHRTIYSQSDHT